MEHTDAELSVPLNYPTSTIFLDESGSKATANKFFVVAALKLRRPGLLAREVEDIRDRHGYTKEIKFNRMTRVMSVVCADIVNALIDSDAHIAACVIDGKVHNPFEGDKAAWEVHAEIITQLLHGCVNRRELVGALMDGISTPRGCSLEDTVRKGVNERIGATAVISASALDSKTNDLLQVADLAAGAIFHQRMAQAGIQGTAGSYKDQVARRFAVAFDRAGLRDGREARLNVATYRGRRRTAPTLRVVRSSPLVG